MIVVALGGGDKQDATAELLVNIYFETIRQNAGLTQGVLDAQLLLVKTHLYSKVVFFTGCDAADWLSVLGWQCCILSPSNVLRCWRWLTEQPNGPGSRLVMEAATLKATAALFSVSVAIFVCW